MVLAFRKEILVSMRFNTMRLSLKDVLLFTALQAGPVCGGDGENDNENENENENDGPASKRIAALKEEKERHYRIRKEAESKALAAQTELEKLLQWKKDLEDKDKSESERLQIQIAEREKAQAELESKYTRTLLENAFYRVSDIDWHNPKRVFGMLDLSDISVEDGNVDEKALKQKLDDIAKQEPYLVKSNSGKKLPKTGNPPKDEGSGKDKSSPTIENLAKKYPSLRGRLKK